MLILSAPVQGHTDAPYRHWHNEVYAPETTYFTPFIRWEKDGPRLRDVKDMTSPLNDPLDLVPQVIFRDTEELSSLLALMDENGMKRVDINIGCPFPLQNSAGRGAAMIGNTEVLSQLPELLAKYPDTVFSMKMRLGYDDPEEWRKALPVINSLDLCYVTMHPRIAKQQYGGSPDLDQFEAFLKESRNPVIYNGDLNTPEDISNIIDRFPEIAGVMTGRGMLARPSLITEFQQGKEWSREKRIEGMMRFHDSLFNHYQEVLCGDSQLLSKIKPFWEYAESEIGRKPWKLIKKASTLAKYTSAIAMVM